MPSPQKGKSKQIRAPAPPQRKEMPRPLLGITDTPAGAHPSWRLSLLDMEYEGRWSWNIDLATLREITRFLSTMERLTWAEVRAQTTGRHRRHHPIPLDRLCPEAQRRLQDLELDEFDDLFRFRIGGRPRLWGVLHPDDNVFYAIWWDPDHQVYPTDPG